jgi:hypothetical protein
VQLLTTVITGLLLELFDSDTTADVTVEVEAFVVDVEGCDGNGYCNPLSEEIDDPEDGFGLL